MSAIPERVWDALTEDEKVQLREIVEGWRHEPRVTCPGCGIQIGVRLKIAGVAVRLDPETGAVIKAEDPQASAVRPEQSALEDAFIDGARQSGMFEAFERTVTLAKRTCGVPTHIGAFMLEFFRKCVAKKVPRFVLDRYIRELQTQRLEFWSADGICAVVADGIVRAFVPLSYVLGTPMYGIGSNSSRMGASPEQLDEWVRGRFGYVPAKSKMFLDEMRQRSIGGFQGFVQ